MIRAHAHPAGKSNSNMRRMLVALAITAIFVLVEAAAGLYANSLALLTDAAHNVTDVFALALSWYALRLAAKPAHSGKTFGYHRAGILAALVNSITLVVIALGIFYEAYQRLLAPPQVEASILIIVAIVAFGVNALTAWMIRGGIADDLNVRSAFVHLAGDALSTFGALVAGIGIALTGIHALDPLASVLIGFLIMISGWQIVHETVSILLESTPRDVDLDSVVRDVMGIAGVRGVHDLHAWSISSNYRALSAHILTDDIPISRGAQIQREINLLLLNKYQIAHSALQLECEGCEPDELFCELEDNGRPRAVEQEIQRG